MLSEQAILLVTGSRSLLDTKQASDWANTTIHKEVSRLQDLNAERLLVVTGDAKGPDAIAASLAKNSLVWRSNGRVVSNGKLAPEVPTWCGPLPSGSSWNSWKTRLLARNREMVSWVADQQGQRYCLALIAPWAKTRGTGYTVKLAQEAGIVTTVLVCPEDFKPTTV